jgi:mono/diheme cytochrome c family protein
MSRKEMGMKKHLALCLVIFTTLVLLVAACGPQPLPQAPTPIPTLAPATLPAATATEPSPEGGPAPGQTGTSGEGEGLVEAGRVVFEQNCAVCHNLTAETKVGPGLAGLFGIDQLPNGETFSQENLRSWIRNGGGAMPGIPLDDADLDAVIAFLQDATQ